MQGRLEKEGGREGPLSCMRPSPGPFQSTIPVVEREGSCGNVGCPENARLRGELAVLLLVLRFGNDDAGENVFCGHKSGDLGTG